MVSVREGQFEVRVAGSKSVQKFGLRDVNGLSNLFKEHGIRSVICSSSVDFPQDSGAPKRYTGNTAHGIITKALAWEDSNGFVLLAKTDLQRIEDLARKHGIYEDLKALEISCQEYHGE